MSEVVAEQAEASPAALIADLTETAVGILDAYQVQPLTSADGLQVRELKASNRDDCSLTETVTPEGVRSYRYIRSAVIIQFGCEVTHTTAWQEGASNVRVTYESDEIGRRSVSTTDERKISYYTHLYLRNQFRLPEKPKPTTRIDRVRNFLGKLTFRQK